MEQSVANKKDESSSDETVSNSKTVNKPNDGKSSSSVVTIQQATAESVFRLEFGNLKREVDLTFRIMIGITIVLGIGFLTMFIGFAAMLSDTWVLKATAYTDLKNSLDSQNNLINKQNKIINEQNQLVNKYSIRLDNLMNHKK